MSRLSLLLWCLLILQRLAPIESIADIVAIIPDRSTPYPNGLHNGLLASAFRYRLELEYRPNATISEILEIRDVGNFDGEKSVEVLQEAIDSEEQPLVYLIWPVDDSSRDKIKELKETRNVPIIQLNQLPSETEWESLIGYAGPDDSLRASNAGKMMIDAMADRSDAQVVALGYPETYIGYHLSIAAFRESIANATNINLKQSLPLDWGSQPAYDAIIRILDEFDTTGEVIHGVYAMDDTILIGAYEALNDRGLLEGPNAIEIVGTVCNGDRELLEISKQYGSTVQSPFLEATLGIDSAMEYIIFGSLTETTRFTPNPITTSSSWEKQDIQVLRQIYREDVSEVYMADSLCTWTLKHERQNGLKDVYDAEDVCDYVECLFIPTGLFIAGYCMAGFNYTLCIVGFALLWKFRNKKIVALAQPFFLGLVLVGALVDTTSIIFMSRDNRDYTDEQLNRSCLAWSWLLALGQVMTTTTLVAKMARVKAVIGIGGSSKQKPSMRRTKVRIREVIGFVIGGLVFNIFVLALWLGLDRFKWTPTVVSTDFQDNIIEARGVCSSESENFWIYPTVILIFHFCILMYGNLLAWQTRKFHKISDSRMVAVSLFNSIQLLIVATIMVALSGDNNSISYIVRASFAFLNNLGVILLVVAPKLYRCFKGQGDVMPNLHITSRVESHGSQANAGRTHITGLYKTSVTPADSSHAHSTPADSYYMEEERDPKSDSYYSVHSMLEVEELNTEEGKEFSHLQEQRPEDIKPTSPPNGETDSET